MRADTAEGVAHKRSLLTSELAARPYPALLAKQFQREARERMAVDIPVLPPSVDAPPVGTAQWTIALSLTEATTERSAPGEPFTLRAGGRLALHRMGQGDVVFARSREATSVNSLTTEQWAADEGAAVRDGLDQALQRLAAALMDELLGQRHAGAPERRVAAFADRPTLAAVGGL